MTHGLDAGNILTCAFEFPILILYRCLAVGLFLGFDILALEQHDVFGVVIFQLTVTAITWCYIGS